MSLAEQLEQAAEALPDAADAIRPANGDPRQLLDALEAGPAARVLAWLLEHAPEEGGELALAWLEEPGGVAIVSAVDESTLPKAGRKTLRRALHTARTRGLLVPGAEQPAPKVARLPDVDQSIAAAYVSPLDPRGARLVYLVESSPGGGAHVFEALIDRDRGVVDFQLYRAGRRQVREFIRDVTGRKGGFAAVEADDRSVRALIARAAERHPSARPFPKPFPEWRSRLLRGAEGALTPGEQAREALGSDPPDAEALDRLTTIVEERGIGPWPPDPERMEAVVSELRVRADGDREAAEASLVEWATERLMPLYTETLGDSMAERFEECAYVYWRREEEAIARACLATATALREGRGAEAAAVRALCDVVAQALATDMKQSLGIGAGEGTEAEPTAATD